MSNSNGNWGFGKTLCVLAGISALTGVVCDICMTIRDVKGVGNSNIIEVKTVVDENDSDDSQEEN